MLQNMFYTRIKGSRQIGNYLAAHVRQIGNYLVGHVPPNRKLFGGTVPPNSLPHFKYLEILIRIFRIHITHSLGTAIIERATRIYVYVFIIFGCVRDISKNGGGKGLNGRGLTHNLSINWDMMELLEICQNKYMLLI